MEQATPKAKPGLGGQTRVKYFALVPRGYNAAKDERALIVEKPFRDTRLVVVSSERVGINVEADPTAPFFPSHVCTIDGRWIPQSLIHIDPKEGDMLIVHVASKKTPRVPKK